MEDFRKILEEIGEHPIIIRSSSLLEDSFGLAFSGKYLSVFLTNQGDIETRLADFIQGLKRVFASTFGPDPILYRLDHGLLDYDERMAMIVQKVVGRRFGDYFFPFVSGVLFSRNVYAWNPKIKKEEGLGRLVFGLGTRAVDRVGSDYPRMIPLSHPLLRPEVTAAQIKKVLPETGGCAEPQNERLRNRRFPDPQRHRSTTPISSTPYPSTKTGIWRRPSSRPGPRARASLCVTFENLLTKTPFVSLAKKILSKVEAAYGRPVDMEFAWDEDKFFILQCRSLSTRKELERVDRSRRRPQRPDPLYDPCRADEQHRGESRVHRVREPAGLR